jgi:hypothetical protein
MARNREINRAKVKEAKKEEQLNSKTEFGITDLVPKRAVNSIIRRERRNQTWQTRKSEN